MSAAAGAAEVARRVREGSRFLSTAHAAPDGDALGSMLATAHGLRALGKEVVLYNRDPAPARLAFLAGASEIVTTPPPGRFDATFVHDCGDPRLLGEGFPAPEVTGPLVVIDHHATARDYGDLAYRDPSASAVGVLVARLLKELAVPLSKPIAEAIFCSLVSDTGWFRYSSTDLETMELATACVGAGVRPWDFARLSEEETPVARLRLLALVLETLELECGGRLALLHVDGSMLARAGATAELAEGFVNHARALAGVEVGGLLTARAHDVRVSLRGKGTIDLGELAAALGGGGHRAAAGCTIVGSLADARRILIGAVTERLAT